VASAEKLLREAQFAFQSISFGESRANDRNTSRASSLCRKIIRKYPGSMEAGEAHAILRRLGEEAYASKMQVQHVHTSPREHHQASRPDPEIRLSDDVEVEAFNWAGLMSLLFMIPKLVIGIGAFAGFILFGIFGWFIFLPLVAFVLLTGPFRQMLKPEQRKEMNTLVAKANAFIEEQRQRGGGFS
jgi:cation transport ATPase